MLSNYHALMTQPAFSSHESSIHGEYIQQPIREQHFAHVTQMDQSESRKFLARKKRHQLPQKSPEILVFLPETPPNLSEPIRPLSRKLGVKFGEEKGNVTVKARTRNLWRANPTRTPLDYRVSHTTRQGKLMYLCCNRKEGRKN